MARQEQSVAVSSATQASDTLLDVRNLTTTINLRRGAIRPVDDVSFTVRRGEVLGLVGESGCGKSTTVLSIMRLVPKMTDISGQVLFEGKDLLRLSNHEMRRVRGRDISMVFQEPMTALDPAFTVGFQIVETILAHSDVSHSEAERQAVEMLERVGIPQAAQRINDYPHEFSGGMRQRVMIAMALVLKPRLLIADEPTSALDVTIQAQILDLLAQLKGEMDMSVILITHDLGVVYEIADRIVVMYAGEIVEMGTVRTIFGDPQHPYTQGLLRSMPDLATGKGDLHVIPGRVPELATLPPACRFAPRCPNRIEQCDAEHPPLEGQEEDYALRCFNPTPFEG